MNILLAAYGDEAPSAPTRSQANSPAGLLVANDDISVGEPGRAMPARLGRQADAAEALERNTAYQHWGINE